MTHEPLLSGTALLAGSLVFGMIFGWLLQRGGVTSYDVIVNQFRLKDFTVVKIMLTAVVVGGIGVALLRSGDLANEHIKASPLLAIAIGAAIFRIGMVVYGYCPGTGVAAIGTGSIHALVGFAGMMLGGILYALDFPWVAATLLPIADVKKLKLSTWLGVPEWVIFTLLAVVAITVFILLERLEKSRKLNGSHLRLGKN